MKKVLLLGSAASMHALGERFRAEGIRVFGYGHMYNPGIESVSEDYRLGSWGDFELLGRYVSKVRPDFAFLGPPEPIAAGVADFLLSRGIPSVGPLKALSCLEGSKAFTRQLLEKYGIPGNIRYRVFHDDRGLEAFLNELGGDYVIKADGLKAGMGVKVSGDHLPDVVSGLAYARECLAQDGVVVIEEKLVGQEFSLMSFCDGEHTVEMPAVQDHKRLLAGDLGPNTPGMGSYSESNHLLPFLKQSDLDQAQAINKAVIRALRGALGVPFKGILFGGFMLTARGLCLLEYNMRSGDPEMINVLTVLKTPLLDICEAIMNGGLDRLRVRFAPRATVCKYLVPQGYPDHPHTGEPVTVGALPQGVKGYLAYLDKSEGRYLTTPYRSVALVSSGVTVKEAEARVEKACQAVTGKLYHRADIGLVG